MGVSARRVSILPSVVALVVAVVAGACTPAGATGAPPGLVQVIGMISASPTCPVQRQPPAPECSPRPVAGADVSILDAHDRQVASVVSGADGRFVVRLQPGSYRFVSSPVEGLLGTPSPVSLTVKAGEQPITVDLSYDTGIR